MGWEKRIIDFVKEGDKKVVFLINLKDDLDKLEDFFKAFLHYVPSSHLVVFFNLEIPKPFLSINLKVKTAEDYLSREDCEELDRHVFEGLSTGWYSYRNITDYRSIPLGRLFEYDFQKYLVPRLKSLEVVRKVIDNENAQKIIVIEDTGELIDVAKLCGKTFNKPVLAISFKRNRKIPFVLSSTIRSRASYLLSNILDRFAYKRFYNFKVKKGLILVDAKLSKYLMLKKNGIAFLPCPLEGGAKIRFDIIKRGSSYLSLFSAGAKPRPRDWITYKERWKDLTSDRNFKAIFEFKGISLWELVCDKLSAFFLKDIARMINNVNMLDRAFKKNNIKIVVLRNDVKELERTIVFCSRIAKVSSLIIQHGILAETNGHNLLIADKYAAWGRASVEWYGRFGNSLEKFEITGNPRFDALVGWAPKISRQKLCARLNLDFNKGIILFATQQINKFSSFWTDDLFWVMADKVLVAMQHFPDKQLIIKVDPYEDIGPYIERIEASSHNNAVAVKDVDIYTLISLSELAITQDSTVGLEAIIFDKPLITINLTNRQDRVPFAKKGAAIGVYKEEELITAINKALTDKEIILKLKMGRDEFLEEFTYRIDGKASERLSNLIKHYVEN